MFYEKLQDGSVGRFTSNPKIAKSCGLTLETDEEIVQAKDYRWFLASEKPDDPEPTYQEKRQEEYPPIKEQLDMIYWDKVNGTHKWQDTISAIKEKYPKE